MFNNKVVLVTGACAGIGAATVHKFAREGATLVIVDKHDDKFEEMIERCSSHGSRAFTIKADLSVDEEADSIIKQTIKKFGKLDVLVNNAGVFREADLLSDRFMELFDEVMKVNMRAVARVTHHAAPHLLTTRGNIVNVSSVAGLTPNIAPYLGYGTSKAALIHFTRCCAHALGERGVRVNVVSPGPVRTDIYAGSSVTRGADQLTDATVLRRVSEPDEVADVILHLASERARGVTGHNYVLDNGVMVA